MHTSYCLSIFIYSIMKPDKDIILKNPRTEVRGQRTEKAENASI